MVKIKDLGMMYATKTSKRKRRFALYKCERCGHEQSSDIQSKLKEFCLSCSTTIRKTTHGGKHTRLYNIWCNIKARCNNPKNPDYYLYGARDIKVYSEWENNFTTFREWAMQNGYDDELTIDRRENNEGYNPDNCRWVTWAVQQANRRPREDW